MASGFKKTVIELDLLTDINMLLMVEKSIRGGIFNAVNHYTKANKKCMEDFEKTKEWQYLQYWDVNNLYGSTMSQTFPAFNFEWVEDTSQFNAVFIKNYDEKSGVTYILEVDVQYPKKLHKLHSDLPFLPER